MTRSLLALLLGLALVAAAPARALELGGRVGLDYAHLESYTPGVPPPGQPHLGLTLDLGAAGAVWSPGTLVWSGELGYARWTRGEAAQETKTDALSYALRSTLFRDRRGPLTANLSALRNDSSFGVAGRSGTDRSTQTAYEADAAYAAPQRPSLSLGYGYSATDQSSSVYGQSFAERHAVRGGVSMYDEAFAYAGSYQGSFGTGTYASENRDEHRVQVTVRARLAPQVYLDVSDSYSLRRPTTTSPFNVQSERNVFRAGAASRTSREELTQGDYTYAHALQSAPTREESEITRHGVRGTLQRRLDPERWTLAGTVALSYVEQRLGADEQRAAGETLFTQLRFRRQEGARTLEVMGGPALGLLQRSGEGFDVGYGGSARASLSHSGALHTRIGYGVRYDSDLDGTEGWSLSQDVTGTASGSLAGGHVSGSLSASAVRGSSALRGDTAVRSLLGTAEYRKRRARVSLQAGVTSGLSQPEDGIPADGLLLPAPYDTHAYMASLLGSVSLLRALDGRGHVRYSSAVAPDRPERSETQAALGLDLHHGALTFSIEDRYVISALPSGGSLRANEVFVRASRSFGSLSR